MNAHNFNAEQSKNILIAVKDLINIHGNACFLAKLLTDLSISHIQDNITNLDDINAKHELNLNPLYLSNLLCNISALTDFLYAIEKAIRG